MPGLVTALKTPCTMCTAARPAQHATTVSHDQTHVSVSYSIFPPTAEKQNVTNFHSGERL